MKKLAILATSAALVFATAVTFAQKKGADPAPAKGATPAEPAKPAQPAAKPAEGAPAAAPAAPTPPAQLDEIKWLEGTWKCKGTVFASDMGPEHPVDGKMVYKRDLDKFWLVGTYTEKKTKQNPMPYKMTEYVTHDGKKWVSVSVDNMGGFGQSTGTAAGNTFSWQGTSSMGGMTMHGRMTIEKKSDKELTLKGDMSMDGKNWKPMFESTCKK